MDFYKYKCSDCGSTRFEKVDNGYKCKYCGNIQDIIRVDEKDTKKDVHEETKSQTSQEDKEQNSGSIVLTKQSRSALISLLICVFGGWFGLHKFLKGEIFWGIIYAVTGGLFGIGYVLDIIKCVFDLAGSAKDGDSE